VYKGSEFKIVPIVMGSPQLEDAGVLSKALDSVLDKDTLIIISVDLSHYYPYDKAVQLDTNAVNAIEKLDPEWFLAQLNRGETEIDAPVAILGLLVFARQYNAKAKVLKYANSGDVTGDKTRVVGYTSIIIYAPENGAEKEVVTKEAVTMEQSYLNPEERKKLLEIAKASIIEAVTKKPQAYPEVKEPHLIQNCGAFVTIKEKGELRGCIGYIQAVKPLYETIKEMAQSAAINDHRFNPLAEAELDNIELEISVLTPMRLIKDVNEIIVGKHGIYIRKGFNSGLLLPQVASEYSWDRGTFLEQACMKAGLPADAWKDSTAQIYIFSAEVFGEKE
jgi:AmmeMemoRadiSam system protein A